MTSGEHHEGESGSRITFDEGIAFVEAALRMGAIDEASAAKLKNLLRARESGSIILTRVEDLSIEHVTDQSDAPSILQRHEVLSVAQETARALYAAMHGKPRAWSAQKNALRTRGGFFEKYDEETVRERIADSRFLIFQLGGRFFNMDTLDMDDFRYVADIHIKLPEDDPQTTCVSTLMDPKEAWATQPSELRVYGYDEACRIYGEIEANRAIAASITDVGIERGYGRYDIVPILHDHAFRHIAEEINTKRTNGIKYMLAQFFNIEGIAVPAEGRDFTLDDYIANTSSEMKHFYVHGMRTAPLPAVPASDVPVQFDWDGEQINARVKIGWLTTAIDLERAVESSPPKQSMVARSNLYEEYAKLFRARKH